MDLGADRRAGRRVVGLLAYHMPIGLVVSSALFGAAYGLLPIAGSYTRPSSFIA